MEIPVGVVVLVVVQWGGRGLYSSTAELSDGEAKTPRHTPLGTPGGLASVCICTCHS